MQTNFKHLLSAIAAALLCGGVQAGNPTASMFIQQSDGGAWSENMSGLLLLDSQDNFSMRLGTGTTGLYQNGAFVDAVVGVGNYWQWRSDTTGGYWSWHSSQTVDNSRPVGSDNPWMSVLNLRNISGHGDPDLTYAFSAVNNTASTQTYTFALGETIYPTVTGVNNVYADLAGGLTTRDGAVTVSPTGANPTLQRFRLSSDNGVTFVNAGVDVGPALSGTSTIGYGPYSSPVTSGPIGSWNYIQLETTFVLTPKDSASFVGYASITPVPEPQALAMVLAGMGLMGAIVRRRRG